MSFAGNRRNDVEAQLDALRAAYGDFDVREHTTEVTRTQLADTLSIEGQSALGGARAVVVHDEASLLVREDPDGAWDAPGGERDPGEDHDVTACRHVHEQTGVESSITDVHLVHRYEFTLVEGTSGATGLWVLFGAEAADPALSVGEDVAEARWFDEPPEGIAADVHEIL